MIPTKTWEDIFMSIKLVEFDKYCTCCKHKRVSQCEEPCNTCLTNPVNEDSHKPVMFEEKKPK